MNRGRFGLGLPKRACDPRPKPSRLGAPLCGSRRGLPCADLRLASPRRFTDGAGARFGICPLDLAPQPRSLTGIEQADDRIRRHKCQAGLIQFGPSSNCAPLSMPARARHASADEREFTMTTRNEPRPSSTHEPKTRHGSNCASPGCLVRLLFLSASSVKPPTPVKAA